MFLPKLMKPWFQIHSLKDRETAREKNVFLTKILYSPSLGCACEYLDRRSYVGNSPARCMIEVLCKLRQSKKEKKNVENYP